VSEENVEVVRRIHELWAQGDFSSADWADGEIVFRSSEALGRASTRGIEAMAREWSDWLRTFESFRSEAFEYFDAGDQVVTFNRFSGTAKASGIPMSEIPGAARFVLRDGKVVELELYNDRKQALRDAVIDPESAGG
jgi:ketosteroid isomerase-like protein